MGVMFTHIHWGAASCSNPPWNFLFQYWVSSRFLRPQPQLTEQGLNADQSDHSWAQCGTVRETIFVAPQECSSNRAGKSMKQVGIIGKTYPKTCLYAILHTHVSMGFSGKTIYKYGKI